MKKYLSLLLIPLTVSAEGFFVEAELADMVEEVVRTTNLQINIPDMRSKYVQIDRIDGLDVCAPEAKKKVKKLQTAFSQHPNLHRTKSIHGVYLRQANGKVSYTPFRGTGTSKNCEHITVSVK